MRSVTVDNPGNFDRDLPEFIRANDIGFLSYINADYRFCSGVEPLLGFHVVRDPRDIIVSGYFSHRNSHPTEGWPELVPHRERLRALSLEEGLLEEIQFSRRNMQRISRWNYDDPRIREVRMETLIERTADVVHEILAHLSWSAEITPAIRDSVLEKYDFEKLSGRPRGAEDQNHHYRNGVSGDWKRYLCASHLEALSALYPGILSILHYE
jgi:hypothetical protein